MMSAWKWLAGFAAALCLGLGGWAYAAGDLAMAVGLWIAGFVLAFVAGAGSYVTDLLT